MIEFELSGGIEDAVTHFAAQGIAEILNEAGAVTARWGWRDGSPAHAVVESSLTAEELGHAVSAHARRHAQGDSWVQATADGRRGVLSPRVAAPKTRSEWRTRESSRLQALDAATTALDDRFIASLGRPAYWNVDSAVPNADAGASRWEMKTRNRGETFVGERLAPLATIVARRDESSIIAGLSGVKVVDEAGKNKPDSRTATGLVAPRPTDDALAWCALWGISATAVWWRPEGVAPTTAVMPTGTTHPVLAALPVFTRCVTPALYRRIVRSVEWAGVCTALNESHNSGGSLDVGAAAAAVVALGVDVSVVFRIHKGGSSSAPERYLEGGRIVALRPANAAARG